MKLILNEKEIYLINAYEYTSENERWYFALEFKGKYTQDEIKELFSETFLKSFQIVDDLGNILTYTSYNNFASARITLNPENLFESLIKVTLTKEKGD